MSTPKALPGFYYDSVKKRYFPGKDPNADASAKGKEPVAGSSSASPSSGLRTNSLYATTGDLRVGSMRTSSFLSAKRQMTDHAYARTSFRTRYHVPHSNNISKIAVSEDGNACVVMDNYADVFSCHSFENGNEEVEENQTPFWKAEMSLPGHFSLLRFIYQATDTSQRLSR